MGNEVDIHTVHFHAQTFIFKVGKINQSKTFIVWWEIYEKNQTKKKTKLYFQAGFVT